MLKKTIAICLIFGSIIVFSSGLIARAQSLDKAKGKPLKIVASFYPMYIMARNVAKDVPGVVVTNLTPPLTGCLHDYTITTNDMKKLSGADIFVANGAGMESFLNRIITQYPQIKIFQLAEGIPLIKGEGGEGDNPHVWVSISNAIIEVNNLGTNLGKIDPAHAQIYRKNTAEYVAKLKTLLQKMRLELAKYRGRKIITFHEAFPYFAQEFGFEIAAVIEREPGSEPSARELADTVDIIKKAGIKALFSEPQYPGRAARTIANETGAMVYTLDPAVIGPDELNAYINIMEKNLEVLKNAFSQ
ncbi:MAG: metal ABC transporter substrate-binding protein [Candidatus Omnitrophota bacterium]